MRELKCLKKRKETSYETRETAQNKKKQELEKKPTKVSPNKSLKSRFISNSLRA